MPMRSSLDSRAEARRAPWTDPKSLATTLVVLFCDAYGSEGLAWDPETIRIEVEDDFQVKLSPDLFDRLMAGIALVTTDAFYRSLPDFINLCNVLGGAAYDPTEFDPADAAECAWGVTEALLLAPPEDDDESPFSDEIVEYIAQAVAFEGLLNPPDVLRLGLREDAEVIRDRVRYALGDDPVAFNAVWDMERARTDDINKMIVARLGLLIRQVEHLPLDNGDAKDVAARLLQNLPRSGRSSAGAPDN